MFFFHFIPFVLPFFTVTVLAGGRYNLRPSHIQHRHHRRNNTTQAFNLVDLYQGQDFFEYVPMFLLSCIRI